MVFVLTINMISNIYSLRRELQMLYFNYLSAVNKDRGLNFLQLRTALLKGLHNLQTDEPRLHSELKSILISQMVFGELVGDVQLPDCRGQLEVLSRRKLLEFYRTTAQEHELNPIAKKWLGSKAYDESAFATAFEKLNTELREAGDARENSGYAFACFTSFSSIKELNRYFRKSKSKRRIERDEPILKNIKVQPFVNVLDINWRNCFYQKRFVISKMIWRLVIFIFMIFLTTPTVS